jgi:dipeptidyl aminopeptidase/acylaminoacyl peptidase
MYKSAVLVLGLCLFLGGCGQVGERQASMTTLPLPTPQVVSTRQSPGVDGAAPVVTTPTLEPIPTSTIAPSPTPELFPLSIEAMRRGSYPGSDITVVNELTRGSNYRRYYVYYLSQGLKIYALLTVPDGDVPAGGWPGIVFNHGYIPPKEYRTTERYVAYVDRLARSGYVIFRIDYRGHDQSEGEASGAYGDPGYEVDVLNAVASLERFPQVNPQKIGMWGHSMGGYLTLRAMVISKEIKAGVIWAGVVGSYQDLLYNWHSGPSVPPAGARRWRDAWVTLYGIPQDNPTFWDSISANSYLADLSGPLQLHHGTGDEEVPPAFSEKLTEEIRAVGGTVEYYTYNGDNHNIANYFNLAMNRTISFFDKYLK